MTGGISPQWSPVMKTGNTDSYTTVTIREIVASMEPGHEDREYSQLVALASRLNDASMEPGHEDREYSPAGRPTP